MVLTQLRSKRKKSGGRIKGKAIKRLAQLSQPATLTKLDETKRRNDRVRGGATKTRVLRTDTVNLFDPKSKKYVQAKIKQTSENPASRHFVRRNILTKGAVVETDKGKAKITSRPGQHGTVNAVLM